MATLVCRGAGCFGGWEELATLESGRRWQIWWVGGVAAEKNLLFLQNFAKNRKRADFCENENIRENVRVNGNFREVFNIL